MKIRDLVKVLADYDQDEDVHPDLLRSILPSPGYDPAPPTHSDFGQMRADIQAFVRENPGATVLSCDDPAARYIGFSAFKATEDGEVAKLFTIPLRMMRHALSDRPALSTPVGRRDLCRELMSGS